ncbi:MAG TPA: hypothetical protein VM841_00590, partial [Actinomycetota bacterium]|nr:hypothetical protein [Actinomycetota bacterium]
MIVPRSVSLALAVVLTAGVPASASQRQVTGRVEIPTFGSPALPRTLYGATQSNGLVGWVLRVTPGRSFTLSTQAAPMGVEDFDIAFYASLDSSAPL